MSESFDMELKCRTHILNMGQKSHNPLQPTLLRDTIENVNILQELTNPHIVKDAFTNNF